MIREIKWPVWLLIISLFVILFIIIGIGVHTINSKASQNERMDQVTVEVNSEQIDSGIVLQTETKDAEHYTSFVSFPFMSIESIDQPIKKWIDEQEKIFHEEVIETSTILSDELKAHFNVQSNITKISKNITSIEMIAEHFVEQEKIYTLTTSFTTNQENEKIVDITDVLQEEILHENILHQLIEQRLIEKDVQHIHHLHTTTIDEFIWSIEKDYLTFYFNPGELGEHKNIIKIHIPILDLHEYLTDSYKDILITDEIEDEIIRLKKAATQEPRELDKDGKYVALTFDDGPNNNVTPRILATLKDYDAKATFYMLTRNVQNNPELALEVAYDGHEIGNHTNTHVNLNAVNEKRIQEEVQDSLERIDEAIGIRPVTFRPPYGEFNDFVLNHADHTNQYVVNWSVDSLDWKTRNANSIYHKVVHDVRPGSIILFHDIHEPTADALPNIMNYLSDNNYEFVTVSELLPLLDDNGPGPYFGK